MKNSSRFEATMAWNFSPLEQGTSSLSASARDARIELDPGQLPSDRGGATGGPASPVEVDAAARCEAESRGLGEHDRAVRRLRLRCHRAATGATGGRQRRCLRIRRRRRRQDPGRTETWRFQSTRDSPASACDRQMASVVRVFGRTGSPRRPDRTEHTADGWPETRVMLMRLVRRLEACFSEVHEGVARASSAARARRGMNAAGGVGRARCVSAAICASDAAG